MREYSLKCKMYILTVILVAYLTTFYLTCTIKLDLHTLISLVFFVFISFISESFAIPLPKGGSVSVTFAIDFAALLIFGYPIASWITIIGTLLNRKYGLGKEKIYKTMFNSAQASLSIISAGLVYNWLGGQSGKLIINNSTFFPLIATAVTYFLVNTTTVTFVLALSYSVSPWKMWFSNMRWSVPNLLALSPIGILMVYAYMKFYVWGVSFLFIPLLVARYSFKLYLEMKEVLSDTVSALINAIEAKDTYTRGHSERVAQYTMVIAEQLKLSEPEIEILGLMALLHDIGKVGIPKDILSKTADLSMAEFDKIKEHPLIGANILKEIKYFGDSYRFVKYHHERYNGKGYPEGIKGDVIPLGARIIAVADAFDAMVSDRPYRSGMSWEAAMEELGKNSGEQHDPKIAVAFMKAYEDRLDQYPLGQGMVLEVAATDEL